MLNFLIKCAMTYAYKYLFLYRSVIMAASYKKLFKLLIDRDMKKKDLAELSGVSGATIRGAFSSAIFNYRKI